MVTVTKDKRVWNITVIMTKDDCPFVYYPYSIHACGYGGRSTTKDDIECTLENCPLKNKEE